MSLSPNTSTFKLNNGYEIPVIALGTWQSKEDEGKQAVISALKNGYRHIDTATLYRNEAQVGEGIKESGVPREEIFVTTKLRPVDHTRVAEAFQDSLDRLGLEYIDLYLMHWPVSYNFETGKVENDIDYLVTYKEMQKLVDLGKVRSIGISNFSKPKVERLLADPEITVKPVVNQIEAHPLLPQPELTKYLQDNDIIVEAYCPLGSATSSLIDNDDIVAIAKKNNVTTGQVLISWAVQRKTVVLPKSVKESRIISNLETFTLSDEDFDALNKLTEKYGVQRVVKPEWNDFVN